MRRGPEYGRGERGRAGQYPKARSWTESGDLLGFFDFPGHDHPPFQETIGGIQHVAISVTPERFAAARAKLDAAAIEYLGPDRGVENSLYLRDPNGVGIELNDERLGVFEGEPLTEHTE